MFSNDGDDMKSNITDWAHRQYKAVYKDNDIKKEDIFYYTYGILHSNGYRKKYKNHLIKGLPKIPFAPDFWSFCNAGRELAWLHLNYDKPDFPRYDLKEPCKAIPDNPTSIRFEYRGKEVRHDSILYVNSVKVYDKLPKINYEVNGRTPIGWLTWVPKKHETIDRAPFRIYTGEEFRIMVEKLAYVGVESDRIIESLPKEFEMENPPNLMDKKQNPLKPATSTLDPYREGISYQASLDN